MRLLMMLAGTLALSACAVPMVPDNPSVVAESTVLDEQAALAVELAYTGAATAATTARRAGLVRDADWPCVQRLDRDAYTLVRGVRLAYDAGNAASYTSALVAAREAVGLMLTRKGCGS